jgi:hypothetical protein
MKSTSDTTKLRRMITLIALVIALMHLLVPSLNIDTITLSLIVIAILPWLAPLFKSIELPGGFKVEFQDLKNAEERVERAGLLAKVEERVERTGLLSAERGALRTSEFAFQQIAEDDPNLALAGLRIEIERRLIQIAESHEVKIVRPGIGNLLRQLNSVQVLKDSEKGALSELVGILNAAVHGAKVDKLAADWAFDVGPRILRALDERISS